MIIVLVDCQVKSIVEYQLIDAFVDCWVKSFVENKLIDALVDCQLKRIVKNKSIDASVDCQVNRTVASKMIDAFVDCRVRRILKSKDNWCICWLLSCASFLLDFWSINHLIPGRSDSSSVVRDCCLLGGTVSLFCLVVAIFHHRSFSINHFGKLPVVHYYFGHLKLFIWSLWQIISSGHWVLWWFISNCYFISLANCWFISRMTSLSTLFWDCCQLFLANCQWLSQTTLPSQDFWKKVICLLNNGSKKMHFTKISCRWKWGFIFRKRDWTWVGRRISSLVRRKVSKRA